MKNVVLLFPGQGAQYVGMGKDFYESYPIVRHVFQEADEILGRFLSRTIFEGTESELAETINSQPAIFVMSMALLRLVEKEMPGFSPKMASGLSLGEYSALCAAGLLSFKEALLLVNKRATYMHEACVEKAGTMAVVLGLDIAAVESISVPDLYVANYNCPGQIVLSGSPEALEKGSALAKEKGAKRVLPLAVRGAFHSPFMESARVKLAVDIREAHQLPEIPP